MPSLKGIDELMPKLEVYFVANRNDLSKQFKFYKAVQEEEGSITDFIIRLIILAQSCFDQLTPNDTQNLATTRQYIQSEMWLSRFAVGGK